MANINRVILTGNLTSDPELSSLPSGTSEWESQDGSKRQAVEVVADTVQFLGSRDAGEGGGQQGQARSFEPRGGELKPDPVPAFGGSGGDDDIPF